VTTRYLYDDQGNLSCQVASSWTLGTCPDPGSLGLLQSYHYDFKNRLAAYTQYDGYGSATDSASYVPDALDRTVSETETHSGSTTTTATVYQGDSTAVTQETLTGAQTGTKTYAYDASGDAITLSTSYSNRYSYLYDPRNSVSLLVDQAGGVKESYGYSAYGQANSTLTQNGSLSASLNPYRFQAKRLDTTFNTYDMGARRYSLTTSRWQQQDVYYDADQNEGLNDSSTTADRYAFAAGNPVNYVEADGHSANPLFRKSCSCRISSDEAPTFAIGEKATATIYFPRKPKGINEFWIKLSGAMGGGTLYIGSDHKKDWNSSVGGRRFPVVILPDSKRYKFRIEVAFVDPDVATTIWIKIWFYHGCKLRTTWIY
jgi:RHS repeat-associated protein